jgi:hypothetical protein
MTEDDKPTAPQTPAERTAADKWRELIATNEAAKTGQGFGICGARPK